MVLNPPDATPTYATASPRSRSRGSRLSPPAPSDFLEYCGYDAGVLVLLAVAGLVATGIALALFGFAGWALIPLTIAIAVGAVRLGRARPAANVGDDEANRIQLWGPGKRKDFF